MKHVKEIGWAALVVWIVTVLIVSVLAAVQVARLVGYLGAGEAVQSAVAFLSWIFFLWFQWGLAWGDTRRSAARAARTRRTRRTAPLDVREQALARYAEQRVLDSGLQQLAPDSLSGGALQRFVLRLHHDLSRRAPAPARAPHPARWRARRGRGQDGGQLLAGQLLSRA